MVADMMLFVFTLAEMLFAFTLAAVVVAVVVLLGVLSLYMKRKLFSEESDAPYKLEPAEQVAVPPEAVPGSAPRAKRTYVKRSKYWTTDRKKKAASKARKTT